jgi:type IV pilus assembly protein PilN
VVKINLLPWRDRLREEKKREFFSLSVLVIALVAFIGLVVHITMAERISVQNTRNQLLIVEIKSMDEKIKEIQSIEKERDSLISRMQIIQELQANRPLTVKLFDSLAQSVTAGIFLEQALRRDDVITVLGTAESNSEVSMLMRNIMSSQWIANPKLTEVKKREADAKENGAEVLKNKDSKAFELEFSIRKPDLTEEEQAEEAMSKKAKKTADQASSKNVKKSAK